MRGVACVIPGTLSVKGETSELISEVTGGPGWGWGVSGIFTVEIKQLSVVSYYSQLDATVSRGDSPGSPSLFSV